MKLTENRCFKKKFKKLYLLHLQNKREKQKRCNKNKVKWKNKVFY